MIAIAQYSDHERALESAMTSRSRWSAFRYATACPNHWALQGPFLVPHISQSYQPPASRAELEARYAAGERSFPETELSDADLSQIVLDGADFGKHSWFADANFSGASLRGTSFRECNVKCANFSNADLTGATFELAAIESIKSTGVQREGVKVKGATFYGYELQEGDELPSWEW